MRESSRAVVCVVAVLVAVSAVAGVGAGDTSATEHVDVEQSGAMLTVSVDQSAFGVNDTSNATASVWVAGESVASDIDPSSVDSGTNSYEVDLASADALTGRDLSSANVTVAPEDGNELRATGLDLRYVALAESGAQYDGNSLVLPVATSVGVPEGTEVALAGAAAGKSETLNATARADGDELVVSRTDEFASLALADSTLTVGSTGDVDLDGGSYDVATSAPDVSVASVNASSVVVDHPLLFDGREYTATVTTTTRDGTEALTTHTGTAGDGSMTTEHGGAVREGSKVTIQYGDTRLGTTTVEQRSAVTAKLSPDGRNVSETHRFVGSGETNVSVFASGSYEQRAHLEGVPHENGTVRFGEAGYELANANYALVFEPDSEEPFTVLLDEGEENATVAAVGSGSSGGVGGGGVVPDLGLGTMFGIPVVLLIAAAVGFTVVVGFGLWLLVSGRGSGGSGDAAGGETPMMDVDVRVVDGMTSELVGRSTGVVFRPTKQHLSARSVKRTVTGEETVSVPQTSQQVSFAADEIDATDSVTPTDPRVELSVPPREVQITVEAAGANTGVPGATVALSFPDGSADERTTDADGTVVFTVPRTVDDRNCELTVEHDRYHSTTAGLTDSVTLDPQTGGARIDARLGGEPAPDVDVVVEPDDEYTRRVADTERGTTGDDGTVTVGDLPVGTYVAHLDFADSDTVETSPVSLEVTADEQTTETVDAEFAFQVDDDQRRRIDDLHRDISDLTPSNRDGAVPYYYGNVLSSVLSTVDDFADSGITFVSHGVDPDEATEATIAAGADAVEYTRTAMTNKQNVDLFSACRGLREARVKWDGDVAVADLVAFLGDGTANHRQEMIARLESVDAVLDEKQDDVSTVTPARDQYEQVREHATGLQELSPAEQRAHFFVGLQLLDAVESTFEQPELVDRLEETVF
jgi:hypothetical protein